MNLRLRTGSGGHKSTEIQKRSGTGRPIPQDHLVGQTGRYVACVQNKGLIVEIHLPAGQTENRIGCPGCRRTRAAKLDSRQRVDHAAADFHDPPVIGPDSDLVDGLGDAPSGHQKLIFPRGACMGANHERPPSKVQITSCNV